MANTQAEREAEAAALAALDGQAEAILRGDFIFSTADDPSRGGDCWGWLQEFTHMLYDTIKRRRMGRVTVLITWKDGGLRDG